MGGIGAARCPWAGDDPLYVRYHDEEWGVPVRDDHTLFEFLVLEGAQAGLAWITILRKRERYREVFHDFDPQRVARMTAADRARLLRDPGIVRNRLKVDSAVSNARVFLDIRREFGSFASYLWAFVDGRPVVNRFVTMADVPAHTELSDRIARDLKRRGMRFVGTTIVYAYLQAVGVVNDHLVRCPRHRAVARAEG